MFFSCLGIEHAFQEVLPEGAWAPVVFGKVGVYEKSKGDILNRRLIFFHLRGKYPIPKAVIKARHSR